jgi:hypothetical protein
MVSRRCSRTSPSVKPRAPGNAQYQLARMPRHYEYPSGNPMLPGLRRVFDISSLGCRPRYSPDHTASADDRTCQGATWQAFGLGLLYSRDTRPSRCNPSCRQSAEACVKTPQPFRIFPRITKYARLNLLYNATCNPASSDPIVFGEKRFSHQVLRACRIFVGVGVQLADQDLRMLTDATTADVFSNYFARIHPAVFYRPCGLLDVRWISAAGSGNDPSSALSSPVACSSISGAA